MTDSERTALSQAIRETVARDGNYASIVNGAEVRQPLVSLALHRRLVMRTDSVERLFEYLHLPMAGSTKYLLTAGEASQEIGRRSRAERVEHLLDLLDRFGGDPAATDETMASVLATLGSLMRPPRLT
jgi:hypothetical protein